MDSKRFPVLGTSIPEVTTFDLHMRGNKHKISEPTHIPVILFLAKTEVRYLVRFPIRMEAHSVLLEVRSQSIQINEEAVVGVFDNGT